MYYIHNQIDYMIMYGVTTARWKRLAATRCIRVCFLYYIILYYKMYMQVRPPAGDLWRGRQILS